MLLQLLSLGLALLLSQTATATLSLIQTSVDTTPLNTSDLNTTFAQNSYPKETLILENFYVHPPIRVTFGGYGDPLPRTVAKTCVAAALTYAFNTSDHKLLSPIHDEILDYPIGNVALIFHPEEVVYWEEWKNTLFLISDFLARFDMTKEFVFVVDVDHKFVWKRVGRGSLIRF